MKMKRLILLPLLALCGSVTAQSTLEINMHDKQCDSIVVNVYNETFNGLERQVRVAAKKGKAKIELAEQTVRMICISTSQSEAKSKLPQIVTFSIPGVKAKLDGTWDNYTAKGHQLLEDNCAFQQRMKPLHAKDAELMQQMQQNKMNRDSLMKYYKAANEIRKEMYDVMKEFVAQHPDRDLSAYLAANPMMGDPEKSTATLTPAVRNGIMKSHVDARIAAHKQAVEEQARRERERQAAIDAMNGTEAPDFTLNDLDGKPLSLSSLRGKYVILDFWGAWCGWCIKGMPEMKKYYDKYSDRMEILGVDCNDTQEKWKAAVAEHNMTWKHVYNSRKDNVPQLYKVQGFPTKVIISPEGKVLKTVVGEDPAFYEYLDELFK